MTKASLFSCTTAKKGLWKMSQGLLSSQFSMENQIRFALLELFSGTNGPRDKNQKATAETKTTFSEAPHWVLIDDEVILVVAYFKLVWFQL